MHNLSIIFCAKERKVGADCHTGDVGHRFAMTGYREVRCVSGGGVRGANREERVAAVKILSGRRKAT